MSAKAKTTAKTAAKTTAKHTTTKKHKSTESAATRSAAAKKAAATKKAEKAKVTAAKKPATPAKPAALAIGDALPVCAFEAVAMSLRLAGQPVHDDDVAELWHLLGEPAEGVPVGEALAAAALFGLAGCRPALAQELPGGDRGPLGGLAGAYARHERREDMHALILRIDVPGPHAVLATPRGWWSWGELYDPWPCQVEETWAVSWS